MCSVPSASSTENTGPRIGGRATPCSSVRAGMVIASGAISARSQRGEASRTRDVGELVVEQGVDPAGCGGAHAVQHHRADAPARRMVVAVRVPLQRPIGVRNERAAQVARACRSRRCSRRRPRRPASCRRAAAARSGAPGHASPPCPRARAGRGTRPCSSAHSVRAVPDARPRSRRRGRRRRRSGPTRGAHAPRACASARTRRRGNRRGRRGSTATAGPRIRQSR